MGHLKKMELTFLLLFFVLCVIFQERARREHSNFGVMMVVNEGRLAQFVQFRRLECGNMLWKPGYSCEIALCITGVLLSR